MNRNHHNMLNVVVWAVNACFCTSAFGGTMTSDRYYTWGISADELNIPEGSTITEAVLTIQGITNWDNNLNIHIVDNPPLDFVANVDNDSGDFFQDFGGLLSGYSYDLVDGDLVITFSQINDENSWVWDIFDYPFDFQTDYSLVSYTSSLLELIDYAGNSTPFGIGFDPDGSNYIYAQMTLELTVKSYEGSVLEQTHVLTPAWSPHSIHILETNKAVYSIGEEIVVDFQNVSGDAEDWIGIYQAGAADSEFIYWLRTDGTKAGTTDITDGSVTFTNGSLDFGDYEVRLFFHNSFNVEANAQFSVINTAPSVTVAKSVYTPQEVIVVDFQNASGDAKDWIGIYQAGAANDEFIYWLRTDGTKASTTGITGGSVTFTNGSLDSGDYEVRLFFHNSYNVEANAQFSVINAAPSVTAAKSVYTPEEALVVDFQNASGEAKDWIGIYQAGAADNEFIYWLRTDGTKAGTTDITDGSVTFTNGSLDSGEYEVRLFFSNSYDLQATGAFTIQ